MEFHSEPNDQKPRKQNVCLSTQAKPRKMLGSFLNFENPERSYDDTPQVVKNAEKSHKKQQVETKIHKTEEVVKYMSYLPNYLERGENPKEKPFNIGVLDWSLLEKWQHYCQDSPVSSFVASECNSLAHNQLKINRPCETLEAKQQLQSCVITDHVRNKAVPSPSDVPENRYKASAKLCHSEFTSHCTNEGGRAKESQVVQSCSKELRKTNCPSDKDQTVQIPSSASVSTSKQRNLDENNSVSKQRNVADNEAFQVKTGLSETIKARKPSPMRRLSFNIGRVSKSSVSQTISDPKGVSDPSCSINSTCDKSNATGRARSSPLRRLLDPLLKPKSVDSHQDARSSERNAKTLKPYSGQREFPSSHSVKPQLDSKCFRKDDVMESHQNGPSIKQALLQIAVKNGLPLFTFTVDNCSDILAATVKEVNCKKADHRWIYTFFSFSEMKKKNANWINQGSKDRNHGYISNIIAQMNVSDVPDRRREFVLSSLDKRDVINQTSDSFPCDELAAIVVKFADGNKGNEFTSDNERIVTVILPGGHHAAPSKGEPSPLIKRWKSGGSCDCGGWDLGCRIRVLANTNHSKNQRLKSNEPQFKLFSQEEVGEKRPMFVLSPFEDGIFSVEFSSSLQLIQAFSCAIAVVNSKTGVLSDSQNSVSANPPVSPVGRV